MAKKRKKPPQYTEGQCLDDVLRAMKRLYRRSDVGTRHLYAVLDAATRILTLDPRRMRTPDEIES